LAGRSRLFTDAHADHVRQRLARDPHLRPNALFKELKELGFQASRATFYRELWQFRQSAEQRSHPDRDLLLDLVRRSRPTAGPGGHTVVLPRPVAPITGESLSSYLSRLAHANHLTLAEVLAVLPTWFTTKINNPDELAQHHMLAPATTDALSALARLARTTPQHLAGALPAFGATHTHGPVRATTACRCCTARRGVTEPVPVHLPVHLKLCTRHGIWLSDTGQPNLDVTACPEIITAPTGSCADTHPSNSFSRTKSRSRPSHPGQPHQPTSHCTGGIDCSPSRPSTTTGTATSAPTTTPTPAQRNTPTPSPSSQRSSASAKTSKIHRRSRAIPDHLTGLERHPVRQQDFLTAGQKVRLKDESLTQDNG
jgi:hypothetical protein